jgi:protocatechuate 3,4-dioxygenase beta subunit
MRRIAWLALGLAILVGLAIALRRTPESPSSGAPEETRRGAAEPEPPPEPGEEPTEVETEPEVEEAPPEAPPPGYAVRGLVVDPDGKPLAGARVTLGVLTVHGTAWPIASGESGPDGTFSLRSPPASLFRVSAARRGFGPALVPWASPRRRAEIDVGTLRLTRDLAVAGRVLDRERRPVAAEVTLEPEADPVPEDWEHRRSASEDWVAQECSDDGSFRFDGVPPGTYRICVGVEIEDGWATFAREHVAAGTEDVLVVVPQGAPPRESADIRIRFTVLDPDGRPVPRGQFDMASGGGWLSGYFRDGVGDEETEGNFPAWIVVYAPADDKDRPLPYGPVRIRLERQPDEPVEIRMRPGLEIRGRVLVDGEPGAARLSVEVPLPGEDLPEDARRVRYEVSSGEDGAFAIAGLPPGAVVLGLAHGQPFVPIRERTVEVGDTEVTVRLRRAASLKGTVRLPPGIRGVRVEVVIFEMTAGGRRFVQSSTSMSEPKGTFAFGASTLDPRSRYEVVAWVGHAAGSFAPTRRGDLVPGGEPIEITPEAGLAITGVVRRRDGSPVGGASVRAIRSGPHGAEARPYRPETTSAPTFRHVPDPCTVSGAIGHFRLPGLEEGEVLLVATAPGLSSLSGPVRARAGESGVILVLTPARTISGRIVDATGGMLEDLSVEAWPEEGPPEVVVRADVGYDGFFETGWLGPGRYRLIARNPWDEDDTRIGVSSPVAAGSRDVRLDVHGGAVITGFVRGPGGGPVRDARVDLRGPGTARNLLTAGDGVFTFRGVPPGRFRVIASILGPPPAHAGAEARPGGQPVVLVLDGR